MNSRDFLIIAYKMKGVCSHDYRLAFNKKSANGGSVYANAEVSKDECAAGFLYEIACSDIQVLDRFEGAPYHYLRKKLNVICRMGMIEANVYVAHPDWIQNGL